MKKGPGEGYPRHLIKAILSLLEPLKGARASLVTLKGGVGLEDLYYGPGKVSLTN